MFVFQQLVKPLQASIESLSLLQVAEMALHAGIFFLDSQMVNLGQKCSSVLLENDMSGCGN